MIEKPPAYEGDEPYVFISYSHKNSEIVYKDLWRLIDQGIRVWYDQGLPAGKEWDKVVEGKITSEKCACVIFYLSPNFIGSDSIMKEINLVFDNNRSNFCVHLGGKPTMKILFDAMNMGIEVDTTKCETITKYFNDASTHISKMPEEGDMEYYDEIINNLTVYDVLDSESKRVVVARKHIQNILFVSTDSAFSRSIMHGVQSFCTSAYNISLSIKLIDNYDKNFDESVASVLWNNADEYEGFVVRPIGNVGPRTYEAILDLKNRGKQVVLLVMNLSPEQLSHFESPPAFVSSDFPAGGRLVGNKIIQIADMFGLSNVYCIALLGPCVRDSIRSRCEEIRHILESKGMRKRTSFIEINSTEPSVVEETLRREMKARDLPSLFKNKHLILFAFNDSTAIDIANQYNANLPDNELSRMLHECNHLILGGYDGVRNIIGDYELLNLGIDSFTIDVDTEAQGRKAGELMNDALFTKNVHPQVNLVRPTLSERLVPKPRRYGSARAIKRLIDTNDILLFDMDVAMANTDEEWSNTYGKRLEELGLSRKDLSEVMSADNGIIIDKLVGKNVDPNELEKAISDCTDEYVRSISGKKPFDFVRYMVEEYGDRKTFAVMSSFDPECMDRILAGWGLDEVISKEHRISTKGSRKQEKVKEIINLIAVPELEVRTDNILLFGGSEEILKEAYTLGFDCVGVERTWNRGRIWHCNAILNDNLATGLFIGLSALDIAYYLSGEPPAKGSRARTDQYALFIGGPAAVAARTFSLLGGKSVLVTSIGNSEVCNALKNGLEEEGVEVVDMSDGTNRFPFYTSIAVDKSDGGHGIISGRLSNFSVDENEIERFIDLSDFCLYDCTLDDTGRRILEQYRKGTKDPIIISAGTWAVDQIDALRAGDVVLASSHLRDNEGLGAMESSLINGDVAVTDAANPIRYRESGVEGSVEVDPAEVADSMSSGDVFRGAFCFFRYARGYDFRKSLKCASQVASCSVTKHGPLRAVKKRLGELSKL